MLDNQSPIPLYYQLKNFIEDQITAGLWKPGDRVPSEAELGTQFNISRTTVRQALGELVNQGVLNRAQGKGTFVAQPRIRQGLTRLTSFTEDMQARRMRSSSQVLRLECTVPPAWVAAALGVREGGSTVVLKRLRLADDTPMAVETSYLLYPLCASVLNEDFSRYSLYTVLTEKIGLRPSRASQQLEAVACPAEEAALLHVRKGSPVLHMRRSTLDRSGQSFEQVESYYRGDRYIFYSELAVE